MKYPAQLSALFDFGRYEGMSVEDVIEKNPHYVAALVEFDKDFALARGAQLHLEEVLRDWQEFEDVYRSEIEAQKDVQER